MTHPSPEDLQALVMGMEVADEPALRRHLAACAACSQRLAREAQLELDLHAMAASIPSAALRPRRDRGRAFLMAAAACLLVALALVWWRSPGTPARPLARTTASIGLPPASPPCLVDPRTLGPGADVFPPAELCRDVRVSAGPLSSPDS